MLSEDSISAHFFLSPQFPHVHSAPILYERTNLISNSKKISSGFSSFVLHLYSDKGAKVTALGHLARTKLIISFCILN